MGGEVGAVAVGDRQRLGGVHRQGLIRRHSGLIDGRIHIHTDISINGDGQAVIGRGRRGCIFITHPIVNLPCFVSAPGAGCASSAGSVIGVDFVSPDTDGIRRGGLSTALIKIVSASCTGSIPDAASDVGIGNRIHGETIDCQGQGLGGSAVVGKGI